VFYFLILQPPPPKIGPNGQDLQQGVVPNSAGAEELATAQFNAAKKEAATTTSESRGSFFRRRRPTHRRSKSLGRVRMHLYISTEIHTLLFSRALLRALNPRNTFKMNEKKIKRTNLIRNAWCGHDSRHASLQHTTAGFHKKEKISFLFGARPQSDTRNRFPFLLLLFAGTNVSLSFHVEKKGKNREPFVN
jgi:hypothetical protein